jgi:hypothetical protein
VIADATGAAMTLGPTVTAISDVTRSDTEWQRKQMSGINKSYVFGGILIFFAFTLSLTFNVYADMERIYVSNESATVSEDAQKAIILPNLTEEVLILGPDLRASQETRLIRFRPFPSEPIVGLAPADDFEKAAAMMKNVD